MNCPYCGSNSVMFIRSNNEDRHEEWRCNRCDMPFSANHGYNNETMDDQEYTMECSMCGKETRHRECGMCVTCEQVWNS